MIDKVAVFAFFAILVLSPWTESKQKKIIHCPEEVSVIYDSEDRNKTAVWPESVPTTISRSSSASCSSTSSFSSKAEDLSASEIAGKGVNINSQPPCFNHDSLVTRRCVQFSASSSPQWIPRDPPTCQERTDDINPCPSPFRSFRKGTASLCILVTVPQPWTSLCTTTGTILSILDLPKKQILDILQDLGNRNITTIWLPAKRNHPYGPILRKLPGVLWGELYPHKYFETLSTESWKLTDECLKMEMLNKTDFILSTANCTENHPMMCLMLRNDEREHLQLACPDGYRTSRFYNEQDRCFKIVNVKAKIGIIYSEARNYCGEGNKLLKFTSVSLKRLIKEMGSKIGLKDDDKCWINEITNSSIQRSGNISVGNANAITIGGEFLEVNNTASLRCVLCEVDAQIPVPEMSLRYIAEEKLLQLNVYSSSGLWRESPYHDGFTCFTDAGQGLVTKVKAKFRESNHWTTATLKSVLKQRNNNNKQVKLHFDVHKTTYKLKFFKKRVGNYWCEGHRVLSFERIMSNKILVIGKTRGNVYSLIIDQHNKCSINMTAYDPTFNDNFKHIEKDFMQNFPKALVSEVRVMGVLNVSNEGTLRVALHLTPKFITGSIQHDFERINNITDKYVLKMGSRYDKISLLSTYGCIPPIDVHSTDNLHWNFTYLGATSVPVELCVGDEGLPIYRKCLGDFSTGGYWGPVSGTCSQRHVTDATRMLHDLVTNSSGSVATDARSVAHNISLITSFPEDLSPADIYFIACVVRNLAQSSSFNKSGGRNISSDIVVVSQIFNQFSRADGHKVMLSQKHLNSSSMFLDYVDALFDQVSSRIYDSDEHSGVLSAITPYLMIQIIDPVKTNVTGLALIRRENEYSSTDADFSQFDVAPLTAYHSLGDVLSLQNIEAAVWVPKNLIDMISNSGAIVHNDQQRNTGDGLVTNAQRHRIVITLLYKDIMFHNSVVDGEDSTNDVANDTNSNPADVSVVGSRIVSVTISGVSQNLPLPIPIIFRPLLKSRSKSCAFWDFSYNSSTTSSSLGGWSDEGCVYAGNYSYGDPPSDDTDSQIDVCVCTHLTHFAELVVGRYGTLMSHDALSQDISWAEQHDRALDVITYLGCSLSLFGICGIIVTAILFRTWRQKPGSKVLLQLSLAVAGQMILLMMSGTVKGGDDTEGVNPSCVFLGACLQYITLSAFSWMFVTALLQFLRYVRVLGPTRPPRFFMKSMLFGWGVPLLPVFLTVSISPESYQVSAICYPSGIALYLGVLLPILCVLLPNLAVFVLVMNNIVRGPDGKVRPPTDKKLLISQLRLCVLLFFLLGLSWLFGLLAASRSAIIFAYLFCLAATLQGFVMFIFFVVCDPSTRKLWYSFLTSWKNTVELKRSAGGSQAELTCSTISTCASTYQ